MTENKEVSKKIGFEVLSRDESSVTFKRVIPQKNRTKAENTKIELGLTKITVDVFTKEEFEKLKRIGDGIYAKYNTKPENKIAKVISSVVDFVVK